MSMITREEYLKALDIVEKYHEQVKEKVNYLNNQRWDMLNSNETFMEVINQDGFTVRTCNFLNAAEIKTVGDLVRLNKRDIPKFRNIGQKTVIELEEFLSKRGLNFGMII